MMTHMQSRVSIHEVLSDAIRYWEPRRAVYNLALAGVVGVFAVLFRTEIRGHLSFETILALLVLAVLANVCYCAAYVADVPMQLSVFRDAWRRWRWMLWLFGVLFGVALAWYWVGDEILPALLGR
jgi:glucan phosphoethanolaminetransferase (alkaline phosphatase superfamily)